ncbi:MAG TPA: PaaI family thioesterase [Pyrinomonadaceae bacterium]|nr:PaaI family thioesterase [Pyrinomonadaceae bacterium]
MSLLTPTDAEYESRIRASFARQQAMQLMGASLRRVEPGAVSIVLPYRADLTQQNGYIHAGIITAIADSACGYAAYTLMPADSGVLSVEFKVNLLRPAEGEEFIAEAQVVKAGQTLTVTRCDVYSQTADKTALIATMLATMIRR